nr:hypothetical protein [PVC group bacterium]
VISLPKPTDLAGDPWINYVHADHESLGYDSDEFGVMISGSRWKCCIRLFQEDFLIRLQDTEVPYLYSERHPPAEGKP